jgi:AcrR family transcriptional regulator
MGKLRVNDTRERILEVAARLFHDQGFAATGVAAILREAGVNSGSLYHFFSSKDALLEGVLRWYLERLGPLIMQPIKAAEPDPLARVFRLLGWYRRFLVEHDCRLGCPIGKLALEVSDAHPELKHLVDLNFQNWTAIMHAWLVEAGADLPDDCDRDSLAWLVLAVVEGGLMQARAAGSPDPFDHAVGHLRAYLEALTGRADTADALLAQTA